MDTPPWKDISSPLQKVSPGTRNVEFLWTALCSPRNHYCFPKASGARTFQPPVFVRVRACFFIVVVRATCVRGEYLIFFSTHRGEGVRIRHTHTARHLKMSDNYRERGTGWVYVPAMLLLFV